VLVAAGCADKTVRLFTFADGKQMTVLQAPAPVRGVAFSPNNVTLAAACDDKSIPTWNVLFTPGQPVPADFGKPLQTFAHAAPASDVTFAPDNISLYSTSADKTAKLWKFASDLPTKNFPHPNFVDAVAFSPNGAFLATGCHDGNVRTFDVAKAAPLKQMTHTMPQPEPQPVYTVAWSPDGKLLASGSRDHSVKIWEPNAGTLVREIKPYKEKEADRGHRDSVFTVAFSPDGTLLATGSCDKTVKIWNVADGAFVRECVNPNLKPVNGVTPSHPGWVYGLRFTPDGKYLISAGNAPQNHGYLAAWAVADGKMVYGEDLPLGRINALALSADGKLIGVACSPQGPQYTEGSSFLLKMPEVVK